MRPLYVSAMYRLPAASKAMPEGLYSPALVAGPVSPLKPPVPFPATVVITPLETLRMRLLPESAIYRSPAESTTTPEGWFSWAPVAGPSSPLKPWVSLPAAVVIIPFETLRMALTIGSAMYRVPAESTATLEGANNSAPVAGPSSYPEVPPPATVVIKIGRAHG